MSKSLFPAPVVGPVMQSKDANQFSMPWNKYLKALGDDMLTANRVDNAKVCSDMNKLKSFKSTVNGNLCYWTYYTDTPALVDLVYDLPYASLLAFDVTTITGTVSVYGPGTKRVTVPANTTLLRGWYVVDFNA